MNKQTPEYIRVREEIAKKIFRIHNQINPDKELDKLAEKMWANTSDEGLSYYIGKADSILEIEGIAILADSQALPHGLTSRLNLPDLEHYLYADSALNRANFKKVVE